MNKLHPFPVTIFGSVVILVASLLGYQMAGAMGFLVSAWVLYIPLGVFVGMTWIVYPWQIGLVGCIPPLLFLVWRFITSSGPMDSSLNESLFIFLPIISMAAGFFGAYTGRRIAIRKKRNAVLGKKNGTS